MSYSSVESARAPPEASFVVTVRLSDATGQLDIPLECDAGETVSGLKQRVLVSMLFRDKTPDTSSKPTPAVTMHQVVDGALSAG